MRVQVFQNDLNCLLQIIPVVIFENAPLSFLAGSCIGMYYNVRIHAFCRRSHLILLHYHNERCIRLRLLCEQCSAQ